MRADGGDRTRYLLDGSQASYLQDLIRTTTWTSSKLNPRRVPELVAPLPGIEPGTTRLTGGRSAAELQGNGHVLLPVENSRRISRRREPEPCRQVQHEACFFRGPIPLQLVAAKAAPDKVGILIRTAPRPGQNMVGRFGRTVTAVCAHTISRTNPTAAFGECTRSSAR